MPWLLLKPENDAVIASVRDLGLRFTPDSPFGRALTRSLDPDGGMSPEHSRQLYFSRRFLFHWLGNHYSALADCARDRAVGRREVIRVRAYPSEQRQPGSHAPGFAGGGSLR